jgi:O-antigen/teichoic acid export membrane protein
MILITLIKGGIKKLDNTLYALGSNINYTLAIWLVSVIINHFLGAGDLGRFSLVQAIISPVALLFQLQMKMLATIEYDIKGRFPLYQKTILFSECVFMIVILVIGIITKQPGLFYAFALFKAVEVYYNLIQGYHQSGNNFRYVFFNSTFRGAVLLLLLIIGLRFLRSASIGFFATNVVLISTIFIYDLRNIRKEVPSIAPRGSAAETRKLFTDGVTISLVACMDALVVSIPRFIIKAEYNEVELGKFTIVLQFFIAATIFVVSVGHPFLVRLKTSLQNNDKRSFNIEVRNTLLLFLGASALVIIGFILFGDLIMRIFWGRENAYLSTELKLSMTGIIPLFLSSIFIYVINSLKYFRIHLMYYPVILISELIFGFFIIPAYGIRGGVMTVVFTQVIRMMLSGAVFFIVLRRFSNGPDSIMVDDDTPAV